MYSIEQYVEELADAQCMLDEATESGDMEERLIASLAVEQAKQNLMRARLKENE